MAVGIQFSNDHSYVNEEQQQLLIKLINTAAVSEGIHDKCEVSVSFVDNEEIRELNKQYRNKDYVTDVLSFPMLDEDDDWPVSQEEEDVTLLGDIIISIPKAREQATEYEHSFERELGFLLVHGFLHLLGYDHQDEASEEEMILKQESILAEHSLKK